MRNAVLEELFRVKDEGYSKYATADGMSFRDPIDAEQLLKAADDLTNESYWQRTNATVTEPSSGEFLVSVTASGAFASVQQDLINWFPAWPKTVSLIIGVKAGTSTKATLSLYGTAGGHLLIADVEKLSGPATAAVVSSRVELTGLSTTEYTYVIGKGYGLDMATATNLWVYIYPGEISAGTGDFTAGDSVYFTEPHLVLGDQVKPRPTQTDPDDWMMAWRPHNRVTKDGAARYSVTDTEGLVSLIGEPYAVGVGHASSWDITHSAGKWTAEFDWVATAGEGIFLYVDYDTTGLVDSTYIELRVSNGTSVIFRKEPGTGVENLYTDALTLGQRYRWRVIRDGDVLMVYQDDKLVLADGDVSDITQHTTGRINHAAPTSPLTFVLHSYPRKASGIIIAGGKASPAYDDPSIRLADPDLAAHTTPVSSAALFTVKQFDDGQNGQFGFDTNLSGNCLAPFWEYQGGYLRLETLDSNVYPIDWNAGEEQTFMMMSRSGSIGHQFLRWDSGKQWIRHAVADGTVVRASSIPAIVNYDMACYITNFALLDLSDIHEAEFCDVLAEDDAPDHADWELFTRAVEGVEITTTITRPDPITSGNLVIVQSDATPVFQIGAPSPSASLSLYDQINSQSTILAGSGLSAGSSVEVKALIDPDAGYVYVFADGVLKGSVAIPANWPDTFDRARVVFSGAGEEQTNFSAHPHPALGGDKLGATDRVVCPQTGDTGTAKPNCVIEWKNPRLFAASNSYHWVRPSDANGLVVRVFSDGRVWLYDQPETDSLITAAAGSISIGDDLVLVLDETYAELFVNGTSIGSTNSAPYADSSGGYRANALSTETWDSVNIFPLYVNLFKI
jgi:hypothetical protein